MSFQADGIDRPLAVALSRGGKVAQTAPVATCKLLPKLGKHTGAGRHVYKDGSKYTGSFEGGVRQGRGTLRYPNGGYYEGEWAQDKYHGKGRYVCSGGVYVGTFEAGELSGRGVFRWPNGDVYEGQWEANAAHGVGTKTFADGYVKTGFWQHLEYFATKAEWDALAEKERLTKEQAEQGYADAQYNLGERYYRGYVIPQDYVEAVKWYTLAAEQGYARAQNSLGVMYRYGRSVVQDDKEAAKWHRLAAEQGNAKAQNNLGVMYFWGRGVEQDYVETVKWYTLAAEQGYAAAQRNLGVNDERNTFS